MSSFPPDLSTEILYRSAVKDVVRFRCVSKLWCSLIDTPSFHNLHLSFSSNLVAIFRGKSNLMNFIDLEFPSALSRRIIPVQPRGNTNYIVGSCDGLVALCNKRNTITLWNPFTRESRKLPQSNMTFPEPGCHCKSFDYGFGYDPTTDDYKLLKSAHFKYKTYCTFPWSSKAEIYSLKTNSWRNIDRCPFNCLWSGNQPGILAENALHWLIYNTGPIHLPMHRKIVGFDLVGEQFYSVPFLDCFYRAFSMTMAALDGHLTVAASYRNGSVDMWVMKEYGVKESWNKAISMMQEKVPPESFSDGLGQFKVFPLAYSRGGDKLRVHRRGKLFWHDLESEEAEVDDGQGVLVDANVNILTASLVSLEDRSQIYGKEKQMLRKMRILRRTKREKIVRRNKRQELRMLEA